MKSLVLWRIAERTAETNVYRQLSKISVIHPFKVQESVSQEEYDEET